MKMIRPSVRDMVGHGVKVRPCGTKECSWSEYLPGNGDRVTKGLRRFVRRKVPVEWKQFIIHNVV